MKLSCLGIDDILLIIGQQQGSHRYGYDHPDQAQECAPYRERQQYYGGVQSHHLAHYLWGEDIVADALADDIDKHALAYLRPELDLPSERLYIAHGGDGYKRDILEIRDNVKDSHEYPKHYGERYPDDGETDTVEHRRTQGQDNLDAEIAVHAVLDVVLDAIDLGTVFRWYQQPEPFHQPRIVY